MPGPQRVLLPDGRRWHFQHGPIDLVLEACGSSRENETAYEQAWSRFEGLLNELVEELPILRSPVGLRPAGVRGVTAARMVAAVWPHRSAFVTPMAAVAGAVADEVLQAMVAGRRLEKAYVNDGGDIAIHLTPGRRFDAGIVTDSLAAALDGRTILTAEMPVRGVATSGRAGRSFSMGIADSVTVLARDAAAADVAATLIGNAVDVDDPAVERVPADALDVDSDLGSRLITVRIGELDEASVATALERGVERAEKMRVAGLIEAALLSLRGQCRSVSNPTTRHPDLQRDRLGMGERGHLPFVIPSEFSRGRESREPGA